MDLWFYGKDVKRKGLPRAGVMGKQRKRQRVDAGPKGPVGTSTPLHAACRGDDAGAVAAILEDLRAKKLAAAVDARDEHGRTPLHLACWAGRGAAAALLLDAGAGAALGAQDAMTALHFASQAGCVAAVERLVAAGAPLDAECTKSLKTPLHFAAARGHAAAVAALLAAGADKDARGYLGATAVCRAARRGHDDVLAALLDAGADPDVPNDKMQSPLHFAAFKKNPKAVDLLLKHGASTLTLDRKGRTPAEDTSDADIRSAILAARADRPAESACA